MPLILGELQNNLKILLVENPPQTVDEYTIGLTNVFNAYASKAFPTSVSSAIASANMLSALRGELMIQKFEQVFFVYSSALAFGMMPNFTATPPAAPLDLTTALSALWMAGSDKSIIVDNMAVLLDAWLRTGTAVNNLTGLTINWN